MDEAVQQIINAAALGGTYALLALGVAIVFSILGMVNFAHGELITITGYAMFFLAGAHLPLLFVAVLAVACATVAAVLMERVAFRPFRGASASTMLLTSFAVAVIIQVLFQNLVDPRGRAVTVASDLTRQIEVAGVQIGLLQLTSIVVAIVMLIAITAFLRRTLIGISIRAAAQDFAVTRLMGIRANAVVAAGFGLSGILAGVAGFLWVAQRANVDPTMGLTPVLIAFVASVVGGLGSLSGAVAAGFLLGSLEVFIQAYAPDDFQPFREALVWSTVLLVLLLRPNGIFRSGREA